jgi:hypothetical protein
MRTLGPPPNPKNPFGRMIIIVFGFGLMLLLSIPITIILLLIGFEEKISIYLGLIVVLLWGGKTILELIIASFLWLFENNTKFILDSIIVRSIKLFIILYIIIPIFTLLVVIFIFLIIVIDNKPETISWFPFGLFITFNSGKLLFFSIPFIASILHFIPKKPLKRFNDWYKKFTNR